MRYVTGVDEKGTPIDVRDPMAARLREKADHAGKNPERLASELFAIREIFGDDLPADPRFTGGVTKALTQLCAHGARKTVLDLTSA